MRYVAAAVAALCLVACSRDPNVLKQKYLQSGNRYYDAGKYKEASIMYRKAIEADRKYGPAYYHLALTNLKLNEVPSAVAALRRSHELLKPGTPESDDTDLKLSEIMIVAAQAAPQGQNAESVLNDVHAMVDGFLSRSPNGWEGHKLSGDLAMLDAAKNYRARDLEAARKSVTAAIAEYRKALTAKPGDPVVTLALGRTLVIGGEAAEAENLFKSLIAKDKTNLNGYYELYRVYVGQKHMPEAEGIIKAAIANNPKNTQLRLTLAQFYFATNKRDDLVNQLNLMKADLKAFPNAYLQAGDFFERVNAFDEAIKQFEEGIKKEPSRKDEYLKAEIQTYIRAGKTSDAFRLNETVLKDNPKDPDAKQLKATFQLDHPNDANDINKAMADLQSVVTARPNNFVARFNLGRAHVARGEYEQARQEFEAAIQLRPDYIPARLAQTQVALVRGDYDAALHDADAVLRISPASVQAIVLKAVALQSLRRGDEARQLLDAVLAKNPKQEETLLEMGVLDLSDKKLKDAGEMFRRAWEADPNNLRGLLGQAKAYAMEGQQDKAIQAVLAEAQKAPDRIDLQNALGNTYVSSGQPEKGIEIFQNLLTKVSDAKQQTDLLKRISEAYLRKGDTQQAIDSLEKARRNEPNAPAILTNLAVLYANEGKQDVARKYYESAIKVDPTNAVALNNLAYLITEVNGDLDLALTYATRAKQKLPNHPEVNDTLGWIYIKKNLTDNALDTYKTLVVQAPQNSTYHYHYAMALSQKGDRADAKHECEAALADKPAADEKQQIQQLMTRLG